MLAIVSAPTASPPARVAWWRDVRVVPIVLLVLLGLPDLLAPPISPTILRQTQTYSQILHFVQSGFSLSGLTMDIDGPRPFPVVSEFPIYQAVVGTFVALLGRAFFWGKLVSLAATVAALWMLIDLARSRWGEPVARRAGWFLAASPITLLIATAIQPDALALAFAAGAVCVLIRWQLTQTRARWFAFLVLLLAAALTKFPVIVPLTPVIAVLALRAGGRWRRPTAAELVMALLVVAFPFVAWSVYRATLMDSSSVLVESSMFFFGDLSRFLRISFYVKPAFILGAMAMCGIGVLLSALGVPRLDASGWLMLAGLAFYYVLMPTAAEQTYYAFAVMPVLAVLMAHGMIRLEKRAPALVRAAVIAAWAAGFAVAAPYTLRQDTVTLAVSRAVAGLAHPNDLLFVMNMHDRGVGIGGPNPSVMTLAALRGWNVHFDTADAGLLRGQIEARRQQGADWIVTTWFTPDLDPWFTPLLPASFSRCPTLNGVPVDGRAIVDELSRFYPVISRGPNFAVLQLS